MFLLCFSQFRHHFHPTLERILPSAPWRVKGVNLGTWKNEQNHAGFVSFIRFCVLLTLFLDKVFIKGNNHFKCFSFQKLNHKQASSAPFSSKLGYGLDFWLVAFVFKRCWIRLAANRILNLCLKSFWSLRPLIK